MAPPRRRPSAAPRSPPLLLAISGCSLLSLLARPSLAAPSNLTTAAGVAAEVTRLTSVVAELKAQNRLAKTGTVVRGETLQKPAEVPRELWPQVDSNMFNTANADERNFRLTNASLAYGELNGIETPAFAPDGTTYLPDNYGNLWKFPPPLGANTTGTIIARLPTRPLGIVVDESVADPAVGLGKSLVVCLAGAGMFRVSLVAPRYPVTMLTSYATAGEDPAFASSVPASASGSVMFANGVAVERATGVVYFTDSILGAPPAPPEVPGKNWDSFSMALASLYAGDLTGRVAKYDPRNGKTTVVSTGSWFSNGIVLADSATLQPGGDESVAIMCETYSARLVRVDLSGPNAGKIQQFSPSLPGYCDGIAASPTTPATVAAGNAATYWVAINSKLSPASATALASSVPLRWAASRVPQQVVDVVSPPFGLVARVDASGKVVETLQDPTGETVARASSATPSPDGTLLFTGSVTAPGLRFVKVA